MVVSANRNIWLFFCCQACLAEIRFITYSAWRRSVSNLSSSLTFSTYATGLWRGFVYLWQGRSYLWIWTLEDLWKCYNCLFNQQQLMEVKHTPPHLLKAAHLSEQKVIIKFPWNFMELQIVEYSSAGFHTHWHERQVVVVKGGIFEVIKSPAPPLNIYVILMRYLIFGRHSFLIWKMR